jgi:hypothetical protein
MEGMEMNLQNNMENGENAYECGNCGLKFKEKVSQCVSCLSGDIKKIVKKDEELLEEEKLNKKGVIKIVVKEPKSKEEELKEFAKSISKGGYAAEEQTKSLEKEKQKIPQIIVLAEEVEEKPFLTSPKKLMLDFKSNSDIIREISKTKYEIYDYIRYLSKNLDRGDEKAVERLEEKLINLLQKNIKEIKKNMIVMLEPEEAIDWLLSEIFKIDLGEFAHKDKINQFIDRIKDRFKHYEWEESIKDVSEQISKKLADRAEFEDFFDIQMEEDRFDSKKAKEKIRELIESELVKIWPEPLLTTRKRVLSEIEVPQGSNITKNLFKEIRNEIIKKIEDSGYA